jgi:hypothetical protein
MKLLAVQFSPALYYFLPLDQNIVLNNLVSNKSSFILCRAMQHIANKLPKCLHLNLLTILYASVCYQAVIRDITETRFKKTADYKIE